MINNSILLVLIIFIVTLSFGCKEAVNVPNDQNVDTCLDSNFVWAKNIGGTLTDSSVSITLSPDSQFSFVAGNFEGNAYIDGEPLVSTLESRDGFFAKFNSSGNVQFVKNIGGPGLDAITGIAAGDDNIGYVTGYFVGESTFGLVTKKSSSLTGKNFFMARVEPDGETVVVQTLGASPINPTAEAYGERIAWDPFEKRVYVEGMYIGVLTAIIRDGTRAQITNRTQPLVWKPFTAVFDPLGNWLDLQPTLTQGKPYTTLNTKDKDGYYYETGTFTGTMTKGPGNKTIVSAGKTDGFITKLCQ